jgi:hypothetical protein
MIEQRLIHYSAESLPKKLRPFRPQLEADMKPRGLWFSVEEAGGHGWKEWCEGEQWGLSRLTVANEVVLAGNANILRLRNAGDIDRFSREYHHTIPLLSSIYCINWGRVARKHHGIIIAPYIWERRLGGGANWYYGWDCASGCIWDQRAIKSVTLLPAREEVA